MDSRETILRIKRGDEDVFAEIIDTYSGYLATVIQHVYTLNAEDTDDIILETMITVWKNSKKLNEELNFKSYLAKIAKNKTIDLLRKKRMDIAELDVDLLAAGNFEADFFHRELVDYINQKISETKEPDRTILILKYHHGLKNKEIADKLKLNPNIVSIKLFRQRSKLKKLLLQMEG